MSSGNGMRGWALVIAAGAAAVGVGFFAAWVLRPDRSPGGLHAVDPADWFTSDQLDQITEFRSGQRLIFMASLVVEFALLSFLALRLPLRERVERARRPFIAAATVGASISIVLVVAALPLGLVALERSRDVGLVTQDLLPWLGDRALSGLIAAALAAVGAAVVLLLIRRLRHRWWIGGAGLVVIYAVLVAWIWPVAISPLFNDYEPLGDGPARDEILQLADRADVDVGEVMVVDAGRRTRAVNAYVTGLGSTKRVVVYDNALNRLDRRELRAILAHELAHVQDRDVQRAVLWILLVAPLGTLFVHQLARRIATTRGVELSSPAVIPALALALAVAVFALQIPGNWLSRGVEANADRAAIELTDSPTDFIELQRRITTENLSDPDPPAAWSFLFSSHPSTVERIGLAHGISGSARPAGSTGERTGQTEMRGAGSTGERTGQTEMRGAGSTRDRPFRGPPGTPPSH